MAETTRILNRITFKNIKLIKNFKLININQNQFIISLTKNFTDRFFYDEKV